MSGFSESPLRQLSPPVPFYPDLLSIQSTSLPLLFFQLPTVLTEPLILDLLLLLPASGRILLSVPHSSVKEVHIVYLVLHKTVSAADKSADTQTDSLLPVAAILPLLSEARLSFAASVSVALKVLVSDLPDFLPALSVVPADFLML